MTSPLPCYTEAPVQTSLTHISPALIHRGSGADAAADAGDDVFLDLRPGGHVRLSATAQLAPGLVADTHQVCVRLLHDRGRGGAHQPSDCYDVRHLPADTGMMSDTYTVNQNDKP